MDNIVDIINSISEGESKFLIEYDAYATFIDGYRGLAIECNDDVTIKESFNSVYIQDAVLTIAGRPVKVVVLYSASSKFDDEYEFLCKSFVSEKKRDIIMTSPFDWFEGWKKLIGNKETDKMVYDVVGELYILDKLILKGKQVQWDSMRSGTFDITSENEIFEVKSTKVKNGDTFVAHSQFQLDVDKISVPLYITYVKVEENPSGDSIDSIMNNLIAHGYNELEEAESYLESKGLGKGTQDRYRKFQILGVTCYPVDNSFPRIAASSFIGGVLPPNISKIEYTVSLNGLTSIKFEDLC